MHIRPLHAWDLSPEEAIALQTRLAGEVITHDAFGVIERVAGVDVGFPLRGGEPRARAAAVLFSFPSLTPIAESVIEEPVRYPYIPGLLSFREAPAILSALQRLPAPPDLILVDGQGRAHPRRFGIACHLGLLLDRPTLGCAKSTLVGRYAEPADEPGAWTPLLDDGEVVGAAVRTRLRVKPVFVSVGHRLSLETAIRLVLACCRGHRLPEPTRLADSLASSRAASVLPAGRETAPPAQQLTLLDDASGAAGGH
ncbi:MAG TPA: deoxyribonuclease V [Chloroflexota bacterium]|nr:deoxyribonuclease V [Chloroflexota bacterium]